MQTVVSRMTSSLFFFFFFLHSSSHSRFLSFPVMDTHSSSSRFWFLPFFFRQEIGHVTIPAVGSPFYSPLSFFDGVWVPSNLSFNTKRCSYWWVHIARLKNMYYGQWNKIRQVLYWRWSGGSCHVHPRGTPLYIVRNVLLYSLGGRLPIYH